MAINRYSIDYITIMTIFIVISARRRRLSFGRDEFLSSAAKKLSNTASEDLKSSDDFHDLHQHLVWTQLKFRNINANYYNSWLIQYLRNKEEKYKILVLYISRYLIRGHFDLVVTSYFVTKNWASSKLESATIIIDLIIFNYRTT